MEQLSQALEGQKKSISDSSGLLKNLLIGIENLEDNMKNIQKEMDYWRNPEVMEAEEELERFQDEVCLEVQVSARLDSVNHPSPENQYSFPAQRPNIFLIGDLGEIPATSAATDVERL